MNFLRTLDPKLVRTVVGYALSYIVLELGLDLDADTQAAIALAVAGAVGYRTANEATVLRSPQADGNPVVPDLELDESGF